MDNIEYYKIVQVSEVLINEYSFKQIVIEEFKEYSKNESWFVNKDNINYQIIRVTSNSSAQFVYEENRVNTYVNYFKSILNISDIKFLDIHICNDVYDVDNEPYDYLNMNTKFNNGVDVSNTFPMIYKAIHNVKSPEKEVKRLSDRIVEKVKNRVKNMPFHQKNRHFVTYIIMGLCILNYIIGLILKYKYTNSSSIYILLGADYKTFTLGLKQFYRLISYAFVHNDILHLFCNMFSLYNIGTYVEYRFGHTKYLIILLFSIICGALTQNILTDNGLCIGMSAGIYGLFVVFIIDTLNNRYINLRNLLPTIIINIGLNFMSNIAWTAHLGGAIAGFVIYYYLSDTKNFYRLGLCVILLLSLGYKYVTIDSIENIYAGTDFEVINIIEKMGFKNYAEKLFIKLLNFYNKYGG